MTFVIPICNFILMSFYLNLEPTKRERDREKKHIYIQTIMIIFHLFVSFMLKLLFHCSCYEMFDAFLSVCSFHVQNMIAIKYHFFYVENFYSFFISCKL